MGHSWVQLMRKCAHCKIILPVIIIIVKEAEKNKVRQRSRMKGGKMENNVICGGLRLQPKKVNLLKIKKISFLIAKLVSPSAAAELKVEDYS